MVLSAKLRPNWEEQGYYNYEPVLPAAIVGAVLFSIVCSLTIVQYFWYRSWYFWCYVLAALMDILGYIARAVSADDPTNRDIYIIQFCLIILAPAVMAAGLYMTFGRIIYWATPRSHRGIRTLWLPARFVTPLFVLFDVVSFAIQLIGASLVSSADLADTARINRGRKFVKIGLGVQLAGFGFFTFVGLRFVLTAARWARPEAKGWKTLAWAVNAACTAILVRSVYRMAEFAEGRDGKMKTKEVLFWTVDSILIWGAYVVFVIWHPGRFLPNLGFRQRKVAGAAVREEDSGVKLVSMGGNAAAGSGGHAGATQ